MNDKYLTSRCGDLFHKPKQIGQGLSIVNANSGLHRYRAIHLGLHAGDAASNQFWSGHQAGSECTRLDSIAGTPDVQVDFIEARFLAQCRCFGQFVRVTASKLKGYRVLARIVLKQVVRITVLQSGAGNHLRIQ